MIGASLIEWSVFIVACSFSFYLVVAIVCTFAFCLYDLQREEKEKS